MLDSLDRERVALAGVLHDGPLQMATAMRLTADLARGAVRAGEPERAAAALDRLEQQAAETAADLRRMVSRLHPVAMEQIGLDGALAALAETMEEEHGIACPYERPEREWRTRDDAEGRRDAVLYQIARTALVAAARNGAAPLRLRLSCGERVELAVEHGPLLVRDPAERRALELGALIMQERAERMGGTLRIERHPDAAGGAWLELEDGRPR